MCNHGKHVIFAFMLLVGNMPGKASGQELVLSERIGSELSRSERDYFGLFPSLLDFESAHFSADTGGYVRAEVNQIQRSSPRQFLMASTLFDELGVYIDLVDVAKTPKAVNFSRLGNLVDQQNKRWKAPSTKVRLSSGTTLKGRLFCSDEKGIGVVGRHEQYDPSNPKMLRVLSAGDLRAVSTGRNNLGWGALIGTAVGGVVGYAVGVSNDRREDDNVYPSQDFHFQLDFEPWESTALIGLFGLVAGTMVGWATSNIQSVEIQGNSAKYASQLVKLQSMSLHKALPPELQKQ